MRLAENRVHLFSLDLCTYEGGYVDGKYIPSSFIEQVKQKGSEPARFAFAGSQVLFRRIDGLEEEIRQAAAYPVGKEERIKRFYAQFEAWHWHCQESLRLKNQYLLGTSVSKFILFGGRLILAHNELLYPYHKWFLRVLESSEHLPIRQGVTGAAAALLTLLLAIGVHAQAPAPAPEGRKTVRMVRVDTPPVIDGKLDEAVWQQADVITDFHQIRPGDWHADLGAHRGLSAL